MSEFMESVPMYKNMMKGHGHNKYGVEKKMPRVGYQKPATRVNMGGGSSRGKGKME